MVFQCAGSSLVDYGKITCKIVLKFPLAPYIVDFPYKESWDKVPTLLVVHGRGKSCSRSWQMLLTDVIKSCHGREQVKMPVAYRENALYFFFYLLYIYLT